MRQITIGDTISAPGEISYGHFEALEHPTGNSDFFPILIAQGRQDGPCLWLTAGVHGVEQVGPAVIYRLAAELMESGALLDGLHGTLVAAPALNPAGLRTMQRQPYHVPADPNRLWPDGRLTGLHNPDKDPPSSLEVAYQRLFDAVVQSADVLIDFHAAWTGSIPFAFRDRILYRNDGDPAARLKEAQELSEKQLDLLKAFGHTIVLEMPSESLFDEDLHRSVSASVLYLARIPAFTVELGTGYVPDPLIVAAAMAGTRNVMRRMGMLDGALEPIQGIPVFDLEEPLRRCETPRVDLPCVVLHTVEPGALVCAGQMVAETRDIWGRPVGEGLVRSAYDGIVLARQHGIYYYPGMPVLSMAIPNDAPLLVPYPSDYFTKVA
jgi:hypothetical protein